MIENTENTTNDTPGQHVVPEVSHATGAAILTRLLKLSDASPGFASLGALMPLFHKLLAAEERGSHDAANHLQRDAALISRLLYMANAGRRAHGGRSVATAEQAMAMLGIDTIRSLLFVLMERQSLPLHPQARLLEAETVASVFCGTLCLDVTRAAGGRFRATEAQICGALQNIGRMMVLYHLPGEVRNSQQLRRDKNLTNDEALHEILGQGFEEISAALAKHWELPDILRESLSAQKGKSSPRPAGTSIEWYRYTGLFARGITNILFRLPETHEKVELGNEIGYFNTTLGLDRNLTLTWIDQALHETDRILAEASFRCDVRQARILLRKTGERVSMAALPDTMNRKPRPLAENTGPEPQEAAGHLSQATPADIMQQLLHRIHDHFGFDRTLLCLPDGVSGLVTIAGIGRNAAQLISRFRCQGARQDLFRMALQRRSDLYIADSQAEEYARLLPDWYARLVGAKSALLLSLVQQDQAVGLLYGDYASGQPQAPFELLNDPLVMGWRAQLQQILPARKRL